MDILVDMSRAVCRRGHVLAMRRRELMLNSIVRRVHTLRKLHVLSVCHIITFTCDNTSRGLPRREHVQEHTVYEAVFSEGCSKRYWVAVWQVWTMLMRGHRRACIIICSWMQPCHVLVEGGGGKIGRAHV